mmetsp:Transcript_32989/g.56948  ORF Transcript_32989/g.56948 Transcript_32989/m.56948 type:complete len:376 (+) Transcript_32989:370-1497(+)
MNVDGKECLQAILSAPSTATGGADLSYQEPVIHQRLAGQVALAEVDPRRHQPLVQQVREQHAGHGVVEPQVADREGEDVEEQPVELGAEGVHARPLQLLVLHEDARPAARPQVRRRAQQRLQPGARAQLALQLGRLVLLAHEPLQEPVQVARGLDRPAAVRPLGPRPPPVLQLAQVARPRVGQEGLLLQHVPRDHVVVDGVVLPPELLREEHLEALRVRGPPLQPAVHAVAQRLVGQVVRQLLQRHVRRRVRAAAVQVVPVVGLVQDQHAHFGHRAQVHVAPGLGLGDAALEDEEVPQPLHEGHEHPPPHRVRESQDGVQGVLGQVAQAGLRGGVVLQPQGHQEERHPEEVEAERLPAVALHFVPLVRAQQRAPH